MLSRCSNPGNASYRYYGGKGISVCDRWKGRGGLARFVDDMGLRPEGTTLDRIDRDGDYCPENCRWATPKEQAEDRCNVTLYELNGESHSLAHWAEKSGIAYSTLHERVTRLGWSLERAMNTQPTPGGWRGNRASERSAA